MNTTQKIIKYLAIAFAASIIASIFFGIFEAVNIFTGTVNVKPSRNGLVLSDYSVEENILSLDIAASALVVKTGDEFVVEDNGKALEIGQTENKLSVFETSVKNITKNESDPVTVYIPKDMIFDKVYIANGAGTISVENISSKDLEINIGAGKVTIDKITASKLAIINGGVGEVFINNADLTNANLDVGMGKFTVNGVFNGNSKIDAGIGELNVNIYNDLSNYTIKTNNGIGSIKVDDKSVSDDTVIGKGHNIIDIDGGIGSINVNFK